MESVWCGGFCCAPFGFFALGFFFFTLCLVFCFVIAPFPPPTEILGVLTFSPEHKFYTFVCRKTDQVM